jgi:mannose-6-phosphate isomerase-like protein (cupin superfamily)
MGEAIDLQNVLANVDEAWKPLTVATLNDYDVRVVKTQGEFTWHSHPDTDEFFHVLSGGLTIRLRDREVELGPGQVFVVPRGQQHQPYSAQGATVLLFEPSGTVNTGDTPSHLTATRQVVEG